MSKSVDKIKKLKGEKKKSKKWLIIGAGVIVIAAIIGASMFKSLDVDIFDVKQAKVSATVWEKGKIVSRNSENIYSEVQGKVKTVHVDTGDKVAKGSLLVKIDITELESQIAQLEGELKAVKGLEQASQSQSNSAQIEQQQLAVEQAQLALDLAKAAYERTQSLYDAGAVTKVELDQVKTEMEAKEKALSQAQFNLQSLRKQNQGNQLQYQGRKESLEAQLNYLKEQRGKAKINAVRDGMVFTKNIKEGDMVSPGILLFTIGEKGKSEIETYVNNQDLVNVYEGEEVTVVFKVPGDDIETKGFVSKIAPVAEEKVSSLGIAEDKIKVKVELNEKPEDIKIIPGMTVDVIFVTREAKNVPAIPKEAVFTDKGENYVWIVKDGKAQLRKVNLGVEGDNLVEIEEGLKAGDKIIINPHQTGLEEGTRVK